MTPLRSWRYHLFGLIPMGPTAVDTPSAPRAGMVWRWLGVVRPVPHPRRAPQ